MIFTVTLYLLVTLVEAQRQCLWPQYANDRFLFPLARCNNDNYTGINTYQLGTRLLISWITTQSRIDLYLYQERGGTDGLQLLLANTSAKSFEFSGYPPQRLAISNTFFFAIYRVGELKAIMASDYINITDPNTKLSGVVTGSDMSTGTSSVETAVATGNGSNSNNYNPSLDMKSQDISIGIGIALAGIGVILSTVSWHCVRKQLKHKTEKSESYKRPSKLFRDLEAYQESKLVPSELHNLSAPHIAKCYHAPQRSYTELSADRNSRRPII